MVYYLHPCRSDLSLALYLTDLSQTPDSHDSWKNAIPRNSVHISKKRYRSLGRGPIHINLYTTLSVTDTLSPYISTFNWDIGIKQKLTSMVWFRLFPVVDLMIKFSIFTRVFLHEFFKILFVTLEMHLITLHKWRRNNLCFTRYNIFFVHYVRYLNFSYKKIHSFSSSLK